MKFIPSKTVLFIFSLLCLQNILPQNKFVTLTRTDSLLINFQNHYKLNSLSVVPFSETIFLRGRKLNNNDYCFFYDKNYFILSDSLKYSIFDTLFITYRAYNILLQKEYKRREFIIHYDDRFADTVKLLRKVSSSLTTESIFGKNIQRSGSITRGFTVGTTRDFTLSSGLRLQLSGKLSDDLEIVAALTDENTPIQPEGNTERLEELDKVFIEVRHPNATGTFGDYDYNISSGEFSKVQRKLQGLKGEFIYNNYSGKVALASSKGKFNTNQFNGTDAVQGPYHLYGKNNERDIILIAGSEKVYIDGVEMKRGEANDFTIEYSNAEITFTSKRIITSATRITVDFEYTDRRYSRNFFGTSFSTEQFNKDLKINVNYFREGDDQDSQIDINLSEEDKNILKKAGDSREAAVKSGVALTMPDSLGNIKGNYSKRDTLINGEAFTYYEYTPGTGTYDVSFSYVGSSKGDYIKESLGNYSFTGIGQGTYLPVIFLPLPELLQVANISVEAIPQRDIKLNLEFAGSSYDKNRFSYLDDKDNLGMAYNLKIDLKPQKIMINETNLGNIGLNYRDRFIQSKFSSIDRINDVEFNRNYNTSETESSYNEQLREISLSYNAAELLNMNSMYGYLQQGNMLKSKRVVNAITLANKKNYSIEHKLDLVNTDNSSIASFWNRQSSTASYLLNKLTMGLSFLYENKEEKRRGTDSLLGSSLKYVEFAPGFSLNDIVGFNFKTDFGIRTESFPIDGKLEKESDAFTQSYELNYKGIKEVNSFVRIVIRDKKYTQIFKEQGSLNSQTILIRSQSRFNLFDKFLNGDLYYEASTLKTAQYEKVFVKVTQGTGNYKYLGDLNNNGIAEENEFEPTVYDGDYILTTIPTEKLYPVVDLKTSTKWKTDFRNLVDTKSLFGKLLTPLSTESSVRIEENSKEPNTAKIYLLNLSSFLNDSTTISGFNQFQQDIFLWENSSEFSIRFRFNQKKSLNQYSTGVEKGFLKERSVRIRFKMVEEIGNQTDYSNQIDNVIAVKSSNRARTITSDILTSDFSYRPYKNVEIGFKFSVGRNQDDYPDVPTVIDLNSQLIRLNFSFTGSGRLRMEIERTELNSKETKNYIPFELTKGNSLGKNYFWRLNFDYKIGMNLQASVSYDGRLQGAGKVIHTARAEARAYF